MSVLSKLDLEFEDEVEAIQNALDATENGKAEIYTSINMDTLRRIEVDPGPRGLWSSEAEAIQEYGYSLKSTTPKGLVVFTKEEGG